MTLQTPWNVTDMDEHDTGDARGDMGFLMEKYIAASSCKPVMPSSLV